MVLAEAPKLYPVFTHHAKELEAAARYLVGIITRHEGSAAPDEMFNRLLNRHREVLHALQQMRSSRNPYVYLSREDRDLVVRVNTWLKEHPEHRSA